MVTCYPSVTAKFEKKAPLKRGDSLETNNPKSQELDLAKLNSDSNLAYTNIRAFYFSIRLILHFYRLTQRQ